MEGWVKVDRNILENPVICKSSERFSTWMLLSLNATHKERDVLFAGKKITLKPGQLVTGRKSLAGVFKVNESSIQRILKAFENAHLIEQQTSSQNRLITILNWDKHQQTEQPFEQQVNNERTTTEQQLNTNKNVKNDKNVKNERSSMGAKPQRPRFIKPTVEEIQSYCRERNNDIDEQRFFDYYEARGWELSKGRKIKDWKACVRTWERSGFNSKPKPSLVEERGGMGEWIS